MIRLVTTLLLFLLSQVTTAQTDFEKGMEQAFALQKENKLEESANLLERITNAETENWLPSYHLALLKVRVSFGTKDKTKQAAQIASAEDHIATADALSPNNSEIYVVKALINVAKVASDPMTYGPTLSAITVELYKKAIAFDKTNPRAHSGLADFEMGGAQFFGQDLTPYCKRIQESIALYDDFESKGKFHPQWGKQRAMQILASSQCAPKKETKE